MSSILASLNALSSAGLTAVLNTLWLALSVTAVIWLALRLMPRVNAATRHAVWWAVLALVVAMPLAIVLPRPAPPVPSPARTETQVQTGGQSSSARYLLRLRSPSSPFSTDETVFGNDKEESPASGSRDPCDDRRRGQGRGDRTFRSQENPSPSRVSASELH
jgi:hypothetical protein